MSQDPNPLLLTVIVFQLALSTFSLARLFPRRGAFVLRAALVIAALELIVWSPLLGTLSVALGGVGPYFDQLVTFVAALALIVAAIEFLCEAGLWAALFCATTGYTMQNLASGLNGLVRTTLLGHDVAILDSPLLVLSDTLLFLVVLAACYLVLLRKIDRATLCSLKNRTMLLMFIVVSVAVIGFDVGIKGALAYGIPLEVFVLLRAVHAVVCVFVFMAEYEILYIQKLDRDRAVIEKLLSEKERQYELSRENIEAINIKAHDLKHHIKMIANGADLDESAVLSEILHEVSVYDSTIDTKNKALDTVLTEKSLACERESITFSCIADGSALSFVSPVDIYALFGNALDNAIEAASALDDPARRSISLTVRRHNSMLAIHVENYFDGSLRLDNDRLATTKDDVDNHGFGIRSMQLIAEKYDGLLTTKASGGVFFLDVMLPVPASS